MGKIRKKDVIRSTILRFPSAKIGKSSSFAIFAAIRRASSYVSSLAGDRRLWLILEYTEVWPGGCLSIALVPSEAARFGARL